MPFKYSYKEVPSTIAILHVIRFKSLKCLRLLNVSIRFIKLFVYLCLGTFIYTTFKKIINLTGKCLSVLCMLDNWHELHLAVTSGLYLTATSPQSPHTTFTWTTLLLFTVFLVRSCSQVTAGDQMEEALVVVCQVLELLEAEFCSKVDCILNKGDEGLGLDLLCTVGLCLDLLCKGGLGVEGVRGDSSSHTSVLIPPGTRVLIPPVTRVSCFMLRLSGEEGRWCGEGDHWN